MEALEGYIKEADESENYYYSLLWRYEYAYQATFYSDPPKAMPVAAEFASIYEAHPSALGSVRDNGGAESYLMITQMGIDPVVSLPQIPMEQWEDMMDKFHALVKRFNITTGHTGGRWRSSGSMLTRKKHTSILKNSGRQEGTGCQTAVPVSVVMLYICLCLLVTVKRQTIMQNL